MAEFLRPDTKLPPYMMLPKFLLDSALPETAKLVYVLLLDRARLSMKNDGWTDEKGRVFIYFTIEHLAAALHKSEMTVKNSLAALQRARWIECVRQGAGMPNRIYVRIPEESAQTDRNLSAGGKEICPTVRQNGTNMTDRKLSPKQKKKDGKEFRKGCRQAVGYQKDYTCGEDETL